MEIKKFTSIDNVGRFVGCKQKGPQLSRYNLIFAENGRGKTTLCAILRSMQTGEHEHITERKTLSPTAGDPSAVIQIPNTEARYRNEAWNKTVSEISIFDSTFVAQNVHAGEYVSREHRTNLLEVIVGEDGVALAKKVNDLDAAIREKNGEISRAKRLVTARVPSGTNLEEFLAFTEDADIDAKIKTKSVELKTAKEAATIKARPLLNKVEILTLPEKLLSTFAKTLDDVSAEAQQRVSQQLARCEMHEKGEAWLSEGLGYLKDDNCPFCGQSTTGLELVDAYKQYFSEAYAALIADIEQVATDLEASLGDAALASLAQVVATNMAGIEFWKQHVAIEVNAPDHDTTVATPLRALRAAAEGLIKRKRSLPLEKVTPDAAFEDACSDQEAVVTTLGSYNESIIISNTAIEEKKREAQGADVPTVERALALLQLTKLRHDAEVKPLCEDYIKVSAEKVKLDTDKDEAKKALDAHADTMISDYETTINTLLEGFGAGFTITNSKKTYMGGTPASSYQILINDHPVDLGDVSTSVGEHSFRTTLSAGDKSTLALAFFLAKLDHDPRKQDQVIVFDDPFNSQDRSRRNRTAELLKKYGSECSQMILLSHDPFFLNLVHSKLPRNGRHCLQLSRVPNNNTTIEEWDIVKETQDGYFKEHAALSSYLLNGARDLINIARKIRPVLEGYMRYRFPNTFPETQWLGDMIKKVRDEGAQHPMHSVLEELEGINDYSKKYHHDTNPGKEDGEPISDGELETFVKRTLDIAGGY